jgi:hypothetical protein
MKGEGGGELMTIKLKIGLILALGLGALLTVGGCARKTATSYEWKHSNAITVAGKVSWQGDLGVKKLQVTAEGFPQAIGATGKAEANFLITSAVIAYEFNLPMTHQAKKTRTVTNRWGRKVGRPTVSYETFAEKYQIIKVSVPSGWKATPSEYKVTKDINHADFTLEKIGK